MSRFNVLGWRTEGRLDFLLRLPGTKTMITFSSPPKWETYPVIEMDDDDTFHINHMTKLILGGLVSD